MSSAEDLSSFSLLDLFRAEVQTHVAALEAGLVQVESAPAGPELLEGLMRAAHSVKGAARIVGLDAVVRVAHALEDAFVAAQHARLALTPAVVDALLSGADLLREVAARPETATVEALGERRAEVDAVVARIQAVARGEGAGRTPEAPSASPPAPPAVRPLEAPFAAEAGAPAPSATSGPAMAPARGEEAHVRVSAQGLSRLLAYAGETLVEARRLSTHARGLEGLRRSAALLALALERMDEGTGWVGTNRERLAAARGLADRLRAELATQADAFDTGLARGEDLASRLYQEVLASRMRPFEEVVASLPRKVRDLARDLGKRVRLDVRGRDVLVDRDTLERLEAPLSHLLTNALDHGVESPEARVAAGKSPEASVRVEARHRGGLLEVEVADDGAGVDLERVRARVVERRLIAAEIAADLSEAELLEFLFLPGFSTRQAVTEISGRGVGLNVVQRLAQEAGGTARALSEPGRGTRFLLVLPITRSVVRAAIVEVSGEPYAFPLTRIERLVRLGAGELASTEGRQHYIFDGRPVGLVPAAEALGLAAGAPPRGDVHAVQVAAGGERYGLAVDRFLGEQDLLVRPLDARLGKVPNLSAAAVLDTGVPVLIVDVEDLVHSVDSLLHQGRLRSIRVSEREEGPRMSRKRVLVVDDSRTVREVERGLLASRGYAVDVAVDGSEGWNAVRANRYDLVITDVDMPRMNGIELVRHIKSDPELRRTPVMIVSYKDQEDDRQRGLEAGADAYVTKGSFQESGWIDAVVNLIGEG